MLAPAQSCKRRLRYYMPGVRGYQEEQMPTNRELADRIFPDRVRQLLVLPRFAQAGNH